MKSNKKKVTRSLHRPDHQMNNPPVKEKKVLNHSSTDSTIPVNTIANQDNLDSTTFRDNQSVSAFLAVHFLTQECAIMKAKIGRNTSRQEVKDVTIFSGNPTALHKANHVYSHN